MWWIQPVSTPAMPLGGRDPSDPQAHSDGPHWQAFSLTLQQASGKFLEKEYIKE